MKRMKKTLATATVFMAVLFLAAGTASAQEKKIEKKVHIIKVEDGKKTVIDTTFTITDPEGFDCKEYMIDLDDEKIICKTEGAGKYVIVTAEGDTEAGASETKEMKVYISMDEDKDGVTYDVSVNDISVHITAPKEKAKEAEKLLEEVKELLKTK